MSGCCFGIALKSYNWIEIVFTRFFEKMHFFLYLFVFILPFECNDNLAMVALIKVFRLWTRSDSWIQISSPQFYCYLTKFYLKKKQDIQHFISQRYYTLILGFYLSIWVWYTCSYSQVKLYIHCLDIMHVDKTHAF